MKHIHVCYRKPGERPIREDVSGPDDVQYRLSELRGVPVAPYEVPLPVLSEMVQEVGWYCDACWQDGEWNASVIDCDCEPEFMYE